MKPQTQKEAKESIAGGRKNLQKSTGAVVVQDPILVRVANSHRDQDLA
jgi:hypothetical protein